MYQTESWIEKSVWTLDTEKVKKSVLSGTSRKEYSPDYALTSAQWESLHVELLYNAFV